MTGIPALFTRMSILSTRANVSVTASRSVTSQTAVSAEPPADRISSTTCSALSAKRSLTATCAPWEAQDLCGVRADVLARSRNQGGAPSEISRLLVLRSAWSGWGVPDATLLRFGQKDFVVLAPVRKTQAAEVRLPSTLEAGIMGAFDVPVIVSPSTVTSNFNVSRMGVVTSWVHVNWFPSATGSRNGHRLVIRARRALNRTTLFGDVENDCELADGGIDGHVP